MLGPTQTVDQTIPVLGRVHVVLALAKLARPRKDETIDRTPERVGASRLVGDYSQRPLGTQLANSLESLDFREFVPGFEELVNLFR
jgi:hypothetical protein